MPRKAPNTVFEHRVTLGDFERKEFKELFDSIEKQKRLNTLISSGAVVGSVAIASVTVWIGFQIWKEVSGIAPDVASDLGTGFKFGSNPQNIADLLAFRSGLMSREEYIDRLYKAQGKKNPLDDLPDGVEPPEDFYESIDGLGNNPTPRTGIPFTDFVLKQLFQF